MVTYTAEASTEKPGLVVLEVDGTELNPDEAQEVAEALLQASYAATNERARARHEGEEYHRVVRKVNKEGVATSAKTEAVA